MEQKKVTYTGVDTEDVTEQLEQGGITIKVFIVLMSLL